MNIKRIIRLLSSITAGAVILIGFSGCADRDTSSESTAAEVTSLEPIDTEAPITEPTETEPIETTAPPKPSDLISPDSNINLISKLIHTITPTDNCRTIQGGCTDGQFLYVILNDGASVNAVSNLIKIDISTMKTVKTVTGLKADHANDLCVNKNTGELIILHNAPNRKLLTVLDLATLEFKRTVEIGNEVFAIAYDDVNDCYYVGLSNGDNFARLGADFRFQKAFRGKARGYTTQGIDFDGKYIYFVMYKKNCIIAFDTSGNYIGEYPISFDGEPENICHIGNHFIITGNNSSWNGGNIYRVIISK